MQQAQARQYLLVEVPLHIGELAALQFRYFLKNALLVVLRLLVEYVEQLYEQGRVARSARAVDVKLERTFFSLRHRLDEPEKMIGCSAGHRSCFFYKKLKFSVLKLSSKHLTGVKPHTFDR